MLIEVAKQKGGYVPDLSFGTHFFQDLVEASIRYLPLYPDDEGIQFNENFLTKTKNMLGDLLPEYKKLIPVIRVINVAEATNGKILKVLINAELDEAMAVLKEHGGEIEQSKTISENATYNPEEWKWRCDMANQMAEKLDMGKYGVNGMYIFGSTLETTASSGSDIDLIVHVDEKNWQKEKLNLWFDGWSQSLSAMNFRRTGYKTDGLLDIHYITDKDIDNKNSYAIKINSKTDRAKPLKVIKEVV